MSSIVSLPISSHTIKGLRNSHFPAVFPSVLPSAAPELSLAGQRLSASLSGGNAFQSFSRGFFWEQAEISVSFQSLSGTLQSQILLLAPLHQQKLPLQHFRTQLVSSSSEKENKKFYQGFVFILFIRDDPFHSQNASKSGCSPKLILLG